MREISNLKRIKGKTILYFVVVVIALLTVTPVLADYLGPNRTVTETKTTCTVTLLSCQYVAAKDIYKYRIIDSWLCSNENKPWLVYPSSGPVCWSGTQGSIYWEKVFTPQNVITTYPPATISSTLDNCNPNNGWCTTAPTVSLNGIEPVSGYYITAIEGSLNGQTFACPDNNCSVSLAEGDNSISYWALSSFGDSSIMETVSAKVDSQLPILSGAYSGISGSNGWYLSPVTFTGAASDATSGLSTFTCSLDGSPLGSCTSISINGEGTHTLVLSASDLAGNTNISEQTVSIDTKSPWLNAALQGTVGSNSWYNELALHASAGDAVPGSGLGSLEYNLDHTGWTPFPVSGVLGLSDGKHVVDIRVNDLAGHLVSASRSYSLDRVAPDVALNVNGTLGQTDWYVTSLELSATATDGTSGVDSFEYSLNNGPWTPYVQPLKLGDGSHKISLWAQDVSGLVTQVDRVYHVDTRAPQIAGSLSGTPGTNGWYISNVTITASTADPLPGSGIEAFTYTLDGSGNVPYLNGIVIPDGIHTLLLSAKDRAGLTHSLEQTIQVDTVNPSLSVNTVVPTWIKGSIQLSGTATDHGSGLSSVEISFNNGQSWQPVTGTNAWTYDWDTYGSTSGKYNVVVRTTDKAGRASEEKIITGVDNHAPNISLPSSWYQWETVTLDIWDDESGLSEARVEISDPDGRWPKRVINLGTANFPLNFKWDRRFGDTTVAPNGTYNVDVIALDGLGNTKHQSASLRVLIDVLPSGPTATPQAYSRITASATPVVSATPTLLPTITPTPVVSVFGAVDATALVTPTPVNTPTPHSTPTQTNILEWLESIFVPNGESTTQEVDFNSLLRTGSSPASESDSGVLWGSAAAAMIGAVTGYVLEERRKREEEKASDLAEQIQKVKNEAKRRAKKMKKLEEKWAQERAWEVALLQAQEEERLAQFDVTTKYDREDALSDVTWTQSVKVMTQRAEEKRKADELKAGLAAYYSGRKLGEQQIVEAEPNWWDKTKSFVSENIIQPLDKYVYEPAIKPAFDKMSEIVTPQIERWNEKIYQPYIQPVIHESIQVVKDLGTLLSEKVYKPYIEPVMNESVQVVLDGAMWAYGNVYQKYVVPAYQDVKEGVQNSLAWANETIYQPYLQPMLQKINEKVYTPFVQPALATLNQSVVQPFVLPFVDQLKNSVAAGASNFANGLVDLYKLTLKPVVDDISQYIVNPLVKKASNWWDQYGEWVHGTLDAAGFVPGFGEVADGLSGLIYLAEGQYIEAGVSLAAMIPLVGDLAKVGKWGLKIGAEVVEEVVEEVAEEVVEKVAKEVAEGLAEELVQETTEEVVEEASEELVEKAVQETVEETLETTAKETVEETSGKILRETREELVSKTVVETAENTAEAVVKDTTDDVVEKVIKETTEEITEETTEQTSKTVIENIAEETIEKIDDKAALTKTLKEKYGDNVVEKFIPFCERYGIDPYEVLSRPPVEGQSLTGWCLNIKDASNPVNHQLAQLNLTKEEIEKIVSKSVKNPKSKIVVLGYGGGVEKPYYQLGEEIEGCYLSISADDWAPFEKARANFWAEINAPFLETAIEQRKVFLFNVRPGAIVDPANIQRFSLPEMRLIAMKANNYVRVTVEGYTTFIPNELLDNLGDLADVSLEKILKLGV